MREGLALPLSCVDPFVRYVHRGEFCNSLRTVFYQGYDCRLFYVPHGCGALHGQWGSYELQGGSLVLLNSGIQYNIVSSGGECMQFIGIHFDYTKTHRRLTQAMPPDVACRFDPDKVLEHVWVGDAPQSKGIVHLNGMQQIEPALRSMLSSFAKGGCDEMLSVRMKEILNQAFGRIQECGEKPTDTIIAEVIAFVDQHYREDLSNDSIGSHLNYHPNYLNKQMVLYTGKSLHQYLIGYRIARATELLLSTSDPISDISANTGFKDICHFSKIFQQKTGFSPSRLRSLRSFIAKNTAETFAGIRQ